MLNKQNCTREYYLSWNKNRKKLAIKQAIKLKEIF